MPNRILRDWADSIKFDGISAESERLFLRLIMKADDFGRFHADPRLVRSGCFPLLETVRTEQIVRWLDELSTRRLLFRYEVGGRAFLSVVNFRQRLKQSVPKFPPAPGKDGNWRPDDADFQEVPGTSGKFPLETETETETETEARGGARGARGNSRGDGFREFWAAYPKKAGRVEAEKAWAKLTPEERVKAITAAPVYAAAMADRLEFVKHAQGWLNGKRFEDDPETWKSRNGTVVHGGPAALPSGDRRLPGGFAAADGSWFDYRNERYYRHPSGRFRTKDGYRVDGSNVSTDPRVPPEQLAKIEADILAGGRS